MPTYSGDTSDLVAAGLPVSTRFVKAGYMATPLKGQWYLSGAKPCAYRAPNNIRGTEFNILYPVRPASGPGYADQIIGEPCPST